jgi:aromatic-L-amino-acid decarboxylase
MMDNTIKSTTTPKSTTVENSMGLKQATKIHDEQAECGRLLRLLGIMGEDLERYLQFEHPDAIKQVTQWKTALGGALPEEGVGAEQVVAEIGQHLIPNGSQIPRPGCSSFITTGATTIGTLAELAGTVAAPQRFGLTAFNYLEEISLDWMAEMFELPAEMKGVYSSGGSIANLVALGAARQDAFERLGVDVARDGLQKPCRIYASSVSHRSIHRAAGVLGMGRSSVKTIPVDKQGRMEPDALREQLQADANTSNVMVAVVVSAGSTDAGMIDPMLDLGKIAREFGVWFHVDGAYGLPGILDPKIHHLYEGLSLADSVIVDAHKWLGAPVGIGATYVRDRGLLERAFTQEKADYLEGALSSSSIDSSMDALGIPYHEYGVELSSPSRGAVVWALIREIGKQGMKDRVCRHNAMAREIARRAREHPNLELALEPTLSICCFRFVSDAWDDLDELNRRIHRQLVNNGINIPSTTVVNGALVIRPCFIGARASWEQATELVDEVLETGHQLSDGVSRIIPPYPHGNQKNPLSIAEQNNEQV